jgi:hypothetical protein
VLVGFEKPIQDTKVTFGLFFSFLFFSFQHKTDSGLVEVLNVILFWLDMWAWDRLDLIGEIDDRPFRALDLYLLIARDRSTAWCRRQASCSPVRLQHQIVGLRRPMREQQSLIPPRPL